MIYLILGPLLIAGLAWLVDMIFMMKDLTATPKTVFGLSTGMFVMVALFSFVSFNLDLVTTLPFVKGTYLEIGFVWRIAAALLLTIMIHAKSKVLGRGAGSHETWAHSLIVAGIVLAGPYAWPYLEGYLPF